MSKDFYIDDLRTTDHDQLLQLMKSRVDYPYWYRNGQSVEVAADEYISYVKPVELGQSKDLFKAIRLKEGKLIGCVALVGFDESGAAEIGYFIHTDYQGQGIATRAAFQVVQAAVTNNGLETLHTTVHPKKVESLKILLNLGLRVVGFQETSAYRELDGQPSPRVVVKGTRRDIQSALERHFSPRRPEITRVEASPIPPR